MKQIYNFFSEQSKASHTTLLHWRRTGNRILTILGWELCKYFRTIFSLFAQLIRSTYGSAFESLHHQIMNLKGWLRGTHYHCSEHHYQQYLDEFCFRTNRRNTEQGIFRSLMTRIALTKSKTFKELTAIAA